MRFNAAFEFCQDGRHHALLFDRFDYQSLYNCHLPTREGCYSHLETILGSVRSAVAIVQSGHLTTQPAVKTILWVHGLAPFVRLATWAIVSRPTRRSW